MSDKNKKQSKKVNAEKGTKPKNNLSKKLEEKSGHLPKLPGESELLEPIDNNVKCPYCGSNQFTVGRESSDNGFDTKSAIITKILTKSYFAGFLVGSFNGSQTKGQLFLHCLKCSSGFTPEENYTKSHTPDIKTKSFSSKGNEINYGCYVFFILAFIFVILCAIADLMY